MMIKGTAQKQNLMQIIHDAILAPGSNWTEISSSKTNDYKYTGTMTDGWVFKSPPIGDKLQSVFLTLKSVDLTIASPTSTLGQGGNHLMIWLADNYVPNATNGQNGTYTNKMGHIYWAFCQVDATYCLPTSLFDYWIDVKDHRILIVIQRSVGNTVSYPQFLYIGYPDPTTNIEGSGYINQFVVGSNIGYSIGSINMTGFALWHKSSAGTYGKRTPTACSLNYANPNPAGLYLLNTIKVTGDGGEGIANTGDLGILDGLFGLASTNIVNSDILNAGSDQYQVFNLSQWLVNNQNTLGGTATAGWYNNSITPTFIAIKIN